MLTKHTYTHHCFSVKVIPKDSLRKTVKILEIIFLFEFLNTVNHFGNKQKKKHENINQFFFIFKKIF